MAFSTKGFVSDATRKAGSAGRWMGLSVLIPLLLAVLFALGDQAVSGKGMIDLTDYEFWQRLVVSILLFVGGFALAYHLGVLMPALRHARLITQARVDGVDGSSISQARDSRHKVLTFDWTPGAVALGAVIILACWAVYVACLFPGTMWYDTSWQVYEHFAGTLSDHHPFLLVYVYGWFIDMGRTVFGDGATGLFVLIAIQLVGAAVAFSLTCSYLRRAGARWGACLGCLLFFALFPYFPMTFASIVKDTLQVVLFMYFLLLFAEVVRTRGEVLEHLWVPIAFILLGLAICVSKKTGVYMIAPALIALVFMKLAHGGRTLMPVIGLLLVAVMFVFLPRLVMPALDVTPGGKQEMLAVPIQQVAHEYVLYDRGEEGYEDAFSEEDIELLDNFLTINHDEIPDEFDYTIADPIKDGALRDDSLIGDFLKLWARLGREHPMGHLEAWIGMEAGWISYDSTITVKVASGTIANNDLVSQYVTWPDSGPKNDFVTSLYNLVGDIPGVNLLYSTAFWATVLPFFALYTIARTPKCGSWRRWHALLAISPWLLTMVTLFVCPVSTGVEVARYIIPMTCAAPLTLGLTVLEMRDGLEDRILGEVDEVEGAGSDATRIAAPEGTPRMAPSAPAVSTPTAPSAADEARPAQAPDADAQEEPAGQAQADPDHTSQQPPQETSSSGDEPPKPSEPPSDAGDSEAQASGSEAQASRSDSAES